MKNLDNSKNIHLIGIGGCGMSAIAKILHEMEYKVSGSDIKESSNTIRLKDAGVKVFIGHDPMNIRGSDIIIISSAIPKNNVEIKEGQSCNTPIIPRADALSWIINQFKIRVCVAGTHGKTTTTSMIAKILKESGKDPTYLIGGETHDVTGNANLGKGDIAVTEADESDGSFLKLSPTIGVITNIEADHMEYFGTLENVQKSFEKFGKNVSPDGLILIDGDHENNKKFISGFSSSQRIITYGYGENVKLRAVDAKFSGNGSSYFLIKGSERLGRVELSIPGRQNVLNSLAAFGVAFEVGIDFQTITEAIRHVTGVRRRFDMVGKISGVTIIDDYAHHPTEIKATLEASKLGWKDRRIICIFQPHRYTRTMHLFKEFGKAFDQADVVVITDVYSAGEQPIEGISGQMIFDEVKKTNNKEVMYIPKKENIAAQLIPILKADDMIIFAGAGDITNSAKDLFSRLKIAQEKK